VDRPTNDLTFGKISNGHNLREGSSGPLHVWFYGGVFGVAILENSNGDISTADHPIYPVFGSRMGSSGSADRMALFPV